MIIIVQTHRKRYSLWNPQKASPKCASGALSKVWCKTNISYSDFRPMWISLHSTRHEGSVALDPSDSGILYGFLSSKLLEFALTFFVGQLIRDCWNTSSQYRWVSYYHLSSFSTGTFRIPSRDFLCWDTDWKPIPLRWIVFVPHGDAPRTGGSQDRLPCRLRCHQNQTRTTRRWRK